MATPIIPGSGSLLIPEFHWKPFKIFAQPPRNIVHQAKKVPEETQDNLVNQVPKEKEADLAEQVLKERMDCEALLGPRA